MEEFNNREQCLWITDGDHGSQNKTIYVFEFHKLN